MKKPVLVDIICSLFILLFIYASLSKLLEFEKFRVQLGKSPLITLFAEWIAWIIPFLEIFISILLMTKRFQLLGLYAAFCLVVLFSAYIVAILKFSEYIPCSCGGILQNMNWTQHLVFNIGFVALAIIGVLIYPENRSTIYCAIKGEAENLKE